MGYNIKDLLDKAIRNAEKRKELYINVKEKNCNDLKINIISNVLIKGVEKNIEFYNNLKYKAEDSVLEEFDFSTYDKISFLINQFQRSMENPKILNVKGLLNFSLDMEEKVAALFIDIQGRFIQSEKDMQSNAYKILSNMIDATNRNIKQIKRFINSYEDKNNIPK